MVRLRSAARAKEEGCMQNAEDDGGGSRTAKVKARNFSSS
jgi:hypothetical protein